MSPFCVKSMVLLWVGSALVGLTCMLNYEFAPSRQTAATCEWPRDSRLARSDTQPTLMMFIHPRCPCSRASLVELGKLVTQCRNPVSLRIVMIRPNEFQAGWQHTDLDTLAEKIPGAIVLTDPDGCESKRFGVTTSGETLLYSAKGELMFQGGLTASRGHEGTSAGHVALKDFIDAAGSPTCHTSVFGCALSNPLPSDPGRDVP